MLNSDYVVHIVFAMGRTFAPLVAHANNSSHFIVSAVVKIQAILMC
jgi:hypothetical protein